MQGIVCNDTMFLSPAWQSLRLVHRLGECEMFRPKWLQGAAFSSTVPIRAKQFNVHPAHSTSYRLGKTASRTFHKLPIRRVASRTFHKLPSGKTAPRTFHKLPTGKPALRTFQKLPPAKTASRSTSYRSGKVHPAFDMLAGPNTKPRGHMYRRTYALNHPPSRCSKHLHT